MKQLLWNIDAMGWFERIEHLLEDKIYQWSGECIVRDNLSKTIDLFLNNGYNVSAISSKGEDYAFECMKFLHLENKTNIYSNLWEKNLMTDYCTIASPIDELIVIGSRQGHMPMSIHGIFLHDFKPWKKDAMNLYNLVKKLEIEGAGNAMLGFTKLFMDNFDKIETYQQDFIIPDMDLDGINASLEIRQRGCYSVPTLFIEENVDKKQKCWKPGK